MERKTLLLLRHGETELTAQHRFVGRTDSPLGASGRRQAAAVAALIREQKPACCFSSPMRRCMETAHIAGLMPEILPELREIDFGQWETLTFEEIQGLGPDELEAWANFDPAFRFPGGERLGDFLSRLQCIAHRIAVTSADTVLMVTHGGIIRGLICHYLGLSSRQFFVFDVPPASLSVLHLIDSGKGVLAGLIPCPKGTEA